MNEENDEILREEVNADTASLNAVVSESVKDQLLAHFHELTNLDDLDQCRAILESTNWNLDQAIQSYFSGGDSIEYISTQHASSNLESNINSQQYESISSFRNNNGVQTHLHNNTSEFVLPDPIGFRNTHNTPFSIPNLISNSDTTLNNSQNESTSIDYQNFYTSNTTSNLAVASKSLHDLNTNDEISSSIGGVGSSAAIFHPAASTSYYTENFVTKRLLEFTVEYKHKKVILHLHDDNTVKRLKELIEENFYVPVKYQKLKGWRNKDATVEDVMLLRDLYLPKENVLFVINTNPNEEYLENTNNNNNNKPNTSSKLNQDHSKQYELFIKTLQIESSDNSENGADKLTEISKALSDLSKNSIENGITTISTSNLKQDHRFFFDTSGKFIELKKTLHKLTGFSPSEQTWWVYNCNNNNNNNNNNNSVNTNQFELMANNLQEISTFLVDTNTLEEIKKLVDDLNDQNSANTTSAAISNGVDSIKIDSIMSTSYTSSSKTTSINSSKLPISVNKTDDACKMSFLVTINKSKSSNEDELMSTASSNPFAELGYDKNPTKSLFNSNNNHAHSREKSPNTNDATSLSPSLQFNSILSKKAKTSDDDLANAHQHSLNDYFDEDESNVIENDDEEDLDDHFISDASERSKPLIPDNCPINDEFTGTSLFVDEFSKRYGPIVPLFYIGSLEDAIKEALMCPAKDRKLLGIYLHSDHTVFHNIFCSKTLCDENVVNFLSSNFVVWPWDLTNKKYENQFYETCSKFLGSLAIKTLKDLKQYLPAFIIVTRTRSSNEVNAVIKGDSTSEPMMHELIQAYEIFERQRILDEKDEQSRDEREKIKREQDAAYQASLEFDKAKRQRQTEENEKLKQAVELEKQKLEEKEKKKQELLNGLPVEPNDDTPSNQVSRIRFRLPNGEVLQRKFSIKDKLNSIMNFVCGHGYFTDEFKLLSSWPRKDLTTEPLDRTLEELKLYPQETLTLEQR